MRKVVCIKAQEWGQKVCVGAEATIYEIPVDGAPFDVEDDHAETLLANESKWRDPTKPIAANSANVAPNIPAVLLQDADGNILDPEATAKALAAAGVEDPAIKPDLPPQPAPPANDLEKESEPAPAENSGGSWPEVSMDLSKSDLVTTARELEEIGPEYRELVRTSGTKQEILDSIEAAYTKMSQED